MSETRITYYEDEVNESIIRKNGCKNYVQLMKKYLNEGKYYPQRGESTNPPYIDPDRDFLKDCSYYWQLTRFLNERENWLKEIMQEKYKAYEYAAPAKCKKDEQGESKYPGSSKNEIIVYCDGEEKLRLKSDQFGFSVGDNISGFKNHLYGFLWDKIKTREEKERDKDYEVIAECICRTRTLGGEFLWPSVIWGLYNLQRGGSKSGKGGSYIEDRVDLTLLEIKHLFEWICLAEEALKCSRQINGWDYKDDILWEIVGKEMIETIPWLRHFGSYENYIQFFCFDDFVDKEKKWMPLDIMESRLEWNKKEILKQPTQYKEREKCSIYRQDRTVEELAQMLKNVSSLTIARSYRMQKVIDGTLNERDYFQDPRNGEAL